MHLENVNYWVLFEFFFLENGDPNILSKCNICYTFPCKNSGTCELTGFKEYTCQCSPGYHGDHCEFEIDACFGGPCENGGTCKVVDNYGRFRYIVYDLFVPVNYKPLPWILRSGSYYSGNIDLLMIRLMQTLVSSLSRLIQINAWWIFISNVITLSLKAASVQQDLKETDAKQTLMTAWITNAKIMPPVRTWWRLTHAFVHKATRVCLWL